MGDAARRAYLRRTSPSERFDDGLRLSQEMMLAVLRREGITSIRTEEEARRAFRVLRALDA